MIKTNSKTVRFGLYSELYKELKQIDYKIVPAIKSIGYIESYVQFEEESEHELPWKYVVSIVGYDGEVYDKAFELLSLDKINKIKEILERYNENE